MRVRCAGSPDFAAPEVLQRVVAALTQAAGGSQGAAAAGASKELTPTMATNNPALLATNLLHEIDHATQVRLRCWVV